MPRVLILGAGFGGLSAAHHLRQSLPAGSEIVLIDRRSHFMMGLRKSWVLVGQGTRDEGQRPLASLESHGIRFLQGSITAIDPTARAAEVDGQRLEADALVVALGAMLAPEAVPGFTDYAYNLYDPDSIDQAAEAVRRFAGGRVLVGIFGAPYKCPPAPYEMAFLLQDFFASTGVNAEIEVFTPQPMTLPVLGEVGCSILDSRLSDHGIKFLPSYKASAIEPREVVFGDGSIRRAYDLLLGVPPHKPPQILADAGLAEPGAWIHPNPATLETAFPGVYAIGDCTEIHLANGMHLPKAGVFAEAEGRVVASHIAARLQGGESDTTFDGYGYCFLEVGQGRAMLVEGNFLAQPGPQVSLVDPSADYLAQKHTFESSRLHAWFGG